MNSNPLVSVIVPNYNHARFLDQRLQSILNQTYKNIEVIILDDCSRDNSLEIIGRYSNNPLVSCVVVNDTNSGSPFKQWDKGLSLAKGELIWIAESDDYCGSDMLKDLVPVFLRRKNCVLAYTTSIHVDENNTILYQPKIRPDMFFDGMQFVRKYMSLFNKIRNASAVLFSKNAAKCVSKDYINYKGAGDYLFWTQIAAQGNVALVSKNLNFYRVSSGSVTPRCFTNGTMAVEDLSVLTFMDNNYGLSQFRKNLARQSHFVMFKCINFNSQEARDYAYGLWNLNSFHSSAFLSNFLFVQEQAMRHLGILI